MTKRSTKARTVGMATLQDLWSKFDLAEVDSAVEDTTECQYWTLLTADVDMEEE